MKHRVVIWALILAILLVGCSSSQPAQTSASTTQTTLQAVTTAATTTAATTTAATTTTKADATTTTTAVTTTTTVATTTTTAATTTTTAATTTTTTTAVQTTASQTAAMVVIDGDTITLRDNGSGTDVNEGGVKKTPILTSDDIGYVKEAGPMLFTIQAIQISDVVISDESIASLFDVEKEKPFALVVMNVSVENTSKDDISFYPDQSILITSTKEQVSSNFWFSDDVGGDFYGQVVKEGDLFFVCEKSSAGDISSLQLRIDSPHDSKYNHFGEDIKIDIVIVTE